MPMRRRTKSLWRRMAPKGIWRVALGVFAVGLFFWSTWQTQRLDQLYRERAQLERDLEYARLRYREAESQWYTQTSPEVVLTRASAELALVTEDASARSLVSLPAPRPKSPVSSWLTHMARGLDRFGELREAYAEDDRQ